MKLKWNKVEIPLVKTWNYFHKVEIESHGIVDQKGIGVEKTCGYMNGCGYEWLGVNCMIGTIFKIQNKIPPKLQTNCKSRMHIGMKSKINLYIIIDP